MEIKWNNLIAFVLGLAALFLLLKVPVQIGAFLGAVRNVGPGHSFEEQTVGLVACGLIFVTLLGLIRILGQNNRRDGG